MVIRDDEGLLFREIRSKVLDGMPEKTVTVPSARTAQANYNVNEVYISFSSGLRLGLGVVLGASIALAAVYAVIYVAGMILSFDASSYIPAIALPSLGNI